MTDPGTQKPIDGLGRGKGVSANLPAMSFDLSAALPLDYASAPWPPVQHLWIGIFAAATSLLSATGIIFYSIRLAQSSIAARSWTCGTGQLTASRTLLFDVPFLLLIPLAAFLLSRHARFAQLFARCGLWGAIIGWFVCVGFILWH
jgi:hypothetical protein